MGKKDRYIVSKRNGSVGLWHIVKFGVPICDFSILKKTMFGYRKIWECFHEETANDVCDFLKAGDKLYNAISKTLDAQTVKSSNRIKSLEEKISDLESSLKKQSTSKKK